MNNRNYTGSEISSEYVSIINERLNPNNFEKVEESGLFLF